MGTLIKGKMIAVSWKKVCQPKDYKGLRLTSLLSLNHARNLRRWDFNNSCKEWACILRGRVFKSKGRINHHIPSFIWLGIKEEILTSWSTRF